MANTEKENLEKKLDDGKCSRRSRPYYPRRSKDKGLSSKTNIESLPDEMVSRILLELDAEDIYESAMLVCRRWYNITCTHNFKQEHLEHSSPGLVILSKSVSQAPSLVTISRRGGIVTIRNLKHPKRNLCSKYWANGLALENCYSRDNYFVANHVTNKRIALPRYSAPEDSNNHGSCIGYAPASKEYKVVLLQSPGLENPKVQICAILTLGADESWRYVDTRHVSLAARDLFTTTPLVVEGFVHFLFPSESNRLLSLNLESEIITETLIPSPEGGCVSCCLPTSKSLTLLMASPGNLSWDVWEMTAKKPGEWNKVGKIDLKARKSWMQKQLGCTLRDGLFTVCWLNDMEVLVLRAWMVFDKATLFYNVRTQEIQVVDLGYCSYVNLHKNSLVWFDHT
ncbi:hypothetical protein MIMGU_mgv1a007747mg [Erythranthe guttata]|uniref:F-box domain-containing protein n=1 Tax=Erythranthe guttata TaxID=4155 RepID=A0A022R950_ERYGU|nr:PREDICTED: putative F-box only protein 15 [Erythranthe guttata]EYU36887.1 hypothetical protein MIMGU_mgv1a007747mg [Erythranthe guttata]|eukprot:XP_012838064.1 PREDICTED: putative F-box only protein 15 [Erythranthe guttata]